MSMYLPNPDVRPVGVEPGEFIDFPMTSEELGYADTPTRPETSPSSKDDTR